MISNRNNFFPCDGIQFNPFHPSGAIVPVLTPVLLWQSPVLGQFIVGTGAGFFPLKRDDIPIMKYYLHDLTD
jgi:hypothetical protein